ncbi:hypothetical protein RDWZM_004449, partial [Blomia tropicalis]
MKAIINRGRKKEKKKKKKLHSRRLMTNQYDRNEDSRDSMPFVRLGSVGQFRENERWG